MTRFGDRISEAEQKLRDRLFGPLVLFIFPKWFTPNHVTALRAFLVLTAIIFFLVGISLGWQIFILIVAALTDFVDGILARARKQYSLHGAYFDHAVDWFLGGWAGILALINGLLPFSFMAAIITLQLGITVIDRVRAANIEKNSSREKVLAIAMGAANFQPSAFSRFQFFSILTGFFLILLGHLWHSGVIRYFGLFFLYAAVVFAAILLFDTIYRLIVEKKLTNRAAN
ncbi:MAG: CDP-alcohol phosphatidyltransferase family protein [Bacillota bacterium]|nr:CDP-alcohol phosphatidyltransferase family protein [Bacillota bacterium]